MPWIVYETTNLVNGKKYRGVHKQEGEEFDGYLGSGVAIRKAIRRHGEHKFERRTLFVFDYEKDAYAFEAYLVDSEWVDREDTYNLHPGGLGQRCSSQQSSHAAAMSLPETRRRMSEAAKARWSNPEYRAKHAASLSSPECKSKMSASAKAKRSDPEYVQRHLSAMNSPETKAKLSKAITNNMKNEKFRKLFSDSQKARFADPLRKAAFMSAIQTPEARANICAAAKQRAESPTWKANHAAALASPQTRARMSASAKKRQRRS
jgi:hypothetical protein